MRQMTGNVILDLQFGSTGKGLIAGFLAERDAPDTVFTAWAANAGHTYIDGRGRKYVHTMLANGIVSRRLDRIMMGPGSLIDPVNLRAEIDAAGELLHGVEILIHPAAAIIEQRHRDEEAGPMTKIGSTKKGVGAAMIHRIRRDPDDHNTARQSDGSPHPELRAMELHRLVANHESWHNAMGHAKKVLVEGAQGYSLSLYHGFYPYCTSRDVSTLQVLADVGIPYPQARQLKVVGTARTFPIRVANRFDPVTGEQVGWSGPCYSDQRELDWREDLGREPELTTVTKLPRRIFTLSLCQLREALHQNGVDELFLNFVNYCRDADHAVRVLAEVNSVAAGQNTEIRYLGLGPTERDVIDMYELGGYHTHACRAALEERFEALRAVSHEH